LAGMGLHGYEPRVNTLFGFPRGIRPGGVIFDIPIAGVQLTDGLEKEKTAQFNQQIGLLSSALEHATPEQMFSTETEPADAISAVKALSKANAEGQRIYQMTRDNIAETLPNLNLAIETEAEIRTALNAGLTVIAHTDNVSVPGWTGSGYIIFNPETGSGAYKISGGMSGGVWVMGAVFGLSFGLLAAGLTWSIVAPPLASIFAAMLAVWLSQFSAVLIALALVGDPEKSACFASGFITGLEVGLLTFFPLAGVTTVAVTELILIAISNFVDLPTIPQCVL